MRILGIDPGQTTGWCLYDTSGFVLECGHAEGADLLFPSTYADAVVIERPKGQGPTRPQVVECGIVYGILLADLSRNMSCPVDSLYRYDVRKALTEATHGTVRVVNDATAWAALVALHGPESARKSTIRKGVAQDNGGPLGCVTGHARAALAVAVAWKLLRGVS